MQLERGAKIYAIVYASVVLFLLILVSATYIPYRNKQQRYHQHIIAQFAASAQYQGHYVVDDGSIERVIEVMMQVQRQNDEQELFFEQLPMQVVVMRLEHLGPPIMLFGLYDGFGNLYDVRYQSQFERKQFNGDLRLLYEQPLDSLDYFEQGIVQALQQSAMFVQRVRR